MVDCCSPPRPGDPAEHRTCPKCHSAGHAVDLNTVMALLTEIARGRLSDAPHRFCQAPACEVVYFTPTDTFTVRDLRVSVWQKEPFGARTICYCFGENEADMAREIAQDGMSRVVERVREHVAAGRCSCEVRNPRGACCLGDLIVAVKRVAHEQELSRR